MLKIKTFSRMINTGNSQGEVDVIDYNLNEYIKQNNISYSDIKRFETAYGSLNPVSLETGIRKTADGGAAKRRCYEAEAKSALIRKYKSDCQDLPWLRRGQYQLF